MGEDDRSMRDRMLDGDLYIADDVIAREIQEGMALTDALNPEVWT